MSHSAERLTVPRDCPHGSAVESSSRCWSHHDGACRARCCKAIPSRRRANRSQRRSDAQPSRTWATARQMSSASLSSGRRPGPTRGPNRSSMVTYSATTRVSRSARARPPRRSTLLQQRRSSAPSSQLSPLEHLTPNRDQSSSRHELPHPSMRACQRGRWSPGRASPGGRAGAVTVRHEIVVRAGVPPTCHKQRSRAVCAGHSRSHREGRDDGHMPLTWTVGTAQRLCWHARGQG
jgi:hypothetical protein